MQILVPDQRQRGSALSLEVHLFDFEQDIYGTHVEVEFRLVRDEKRFDSFDQLRRQIELGAMNPRREFFNRRFEFETTE